MIDGNEIKNRLAARAEDVCRFLLPTGKRVKQEWCVGDIDGAAGASLRIHLEGEKTLWYADFAARDQIRGKNGLSLWMSVRRCDFATAIKEAKEFLGIHEERWRRAGSPIVKKSPPPQSEDLSKSYTLLNPHGAVYQYLTEKRGISRDTLDRYRVGESHDGKWIAFPFFEAGGQLVLVKFIALERDARGKKDVRVKPAGGPKLLFGIQAIHPDQTDIFITEGEIDALSMMEMGFPAVSVPFGAKSSGKDPKEGEPDTDPNMEWIEHDYDWLEKFTEVYISMDMDDPGKKAAASIAPRLGRHRCMLVDWPEGANDANDALLLGLDDAQLERIVLEEARNLDPAALKQPMDYFQETWEQFYPTTGILPGVPTPWAMPFRFRPSEVTVWQGYTKHGKTVCLDFHLVNFAADHDQRSCIASLEIPAPATLANIERQSLSVRKPASEDIHRRCMDWMQRYFWIYDYVGTAATNDLLEVFAYAARKYGISHFVIDSLMRTTVDEEDNDSQKALLNRLLEFAAEYQVHVHLIAHSKKPDSRHPENTCWPTKYQVRGSAHIVDLPHNVVCVWRNKNKEIMLAGAQDNFEDADKLQDGDEKTKITDKAQGIYDKYINEPDAHFVVQGQRGGNGEEPVKRLFFDNKNSWQFMDNQEDAPQIYADTITIKDVEKKPEKEVDGEEQWRKPEGRRTRASVTADKT